MRSCALPLWIVCFFGVAATTGDGIKARAVSRVQRDFPGVQVYSERDSIARVCGAPFGFGASPEQSADEFIRTYAGDLGLRGDELIPGNSTNGVYTQPLVYDRSTGAFKFTLLHYSQYRDGVPVYRAGLRLLVRNESGYPLVWAGVSLRDVGRFSVPAGAVAHVAEGAAHAAAARAVPGLTDFGAGELVIWAGYDEMRAAPSLAIRFVAENDPAATGKYLKWEFVADAASGAVLYQEDQIIFEDVVGNVSGLATASVPAAADFCNPELGMPFKYAQVSIGDTSVYADENGDYIIPNAGSDAVTVTSPIAGRWFRVENHGGPDEILTLTVTPPGPAEFLHNPDNLAEFVRSQTNGYVQANVVRDYVLSVNPAFPVIYAQTNFPVRVNRNDGYCPGNAWYDGGGINFCRSSSGYSNTAYSSVLHHEYGHHLVQVGGSGQGQYGEGMSDCVAMLIADDPILGRGFFLSSCVGGLRNANNNKQYPCSGEIHDCGNLLSACVWHTRNALQANYPDTYLEILEDLTLNSIMMHDGNLITPAITFDFLVLDDNDGFLYNGTPHYDEICAGFGQHNMPCIAIQTGLRVSPDEELEAYGEPGGPFSPTSLDYVLVNIGSHAFDYEVTKTQDWIAVANASGTLAAGAQTTVTLAIDPAAGNLPEGTYTDLVTFTNTTNHQGDATRGVTLYVGGPQAVYRWTLDTDPGWSTTGQWAFGPPTGAGGTLFGRPDPTVGATGQSVYGVNLNGDYAPTPGGPYYVTVGPLDLHNVTSATVRFRRWLNTDFQPYVYATVEASANGADWVAAWANGTTQIAEQEWSRQKYDIAAVADLQPAVYVRWGYEVGAGAWPYAGWNIDDVEIWGATIAGAGRGDLNCDGFVNFDDINPFVEALSDADSYQSRYPDCDVGNADCDGNGAVTFDDIAAFVALLDQ